MRTSPVRFWLCVHVQSPDVSLPQAYLVWKSQVLGSHSAFCQFQPQRGSSSHGCWSWCFHLQSVKQSALSVSQTQRVKLRQASFVVRTSHCSWHCDADVCL